MEYGLLGLISSREHRRVSLFHQTKFLTNKKHSKQVGRTSDLTLGTAKMTMYRKSTFMADEMSNYQTDDPIDGLSDASRSTRLKIP